VQTLFILPSVIYWNKLELLNIILTNSLVQWSRVLREQLIVTQLFKKFRLFYGNWRFIAVLIRAHN